MVDQLKRAKLVPLNTMIYQSQQDWLSAQAVDAVKQAAVVRAALQLYREHVERIENGDEEKISESS